MPLLIGIVLLALGISLAVAVWSSAFVAALEVFAVIALLSVGLIFFLVGYSATKAARSCAEAMDEEDDKAKNDLQSASVES